MAKQIEAYGYRFGRFRLYNVDLLRAQSYFYDKDLFPLTFCHFDSKQSTNLKVQDNIYSTDYHLPIFKSMYLTISLKKEGKITKPTDRINSISVQLPNENIEIQKQSEADTTQELMNEINKMIDPDFIFTNDGDSFTFPHLVHRAKENENIPLTLGGEPIPLQKTNGTFQLFSQTIS